MPYVQSGAGEVFLQSLSRCFGGGFANVAYYISGIPPYSKTYEGLTEEKKLKMLKEINSIFEKYLAYKESFSEILNYVIAFYESLADSEQAVFKKITKSRIRKKIENEE